MDWQDIAGVGRVTMSRFSAKEVDATTGLSTELQRVWRRRGHLPSCGEGRASFDSNEVAAIAVRHELARFGFAPSDTIEVGRLACPIVLYFALLTSAGAINLRGDRKRVAEVSQRFAQDDEMARAIARVQWPRRYLCSSDPPALDFVDDAATVLSDERFPAMFVLDLALIGQRLVAQNAKPLFFVDVDG